MAGNNPNGPLPYQVWAQAVLSGQAVPAPFNYAPGWPLQRFMLGHMCAGLVENVLQNQFDIRE